MGFLLFILGLLLPLAVVGGVESVFYVIDLIKYRKDLRRIKFSQKLADAVFVSAAENLKQSESLKEKSKEK